MRQYSVGWITVDSDGKPSGGLCYPDGVTLEAALEVVERIKRTDPQTLCVYIVRDEEQADGTFKYVECLYLETFVDAFGHRLPEWRRPKVDIARGGGA